MINDDKKFTKFELAFSSFLEGQKETTETTEFKTKMEWTKCMFCKNDNSEKIVNPTKSKKQGTSKTFQCIEEDLQKFEETEFRDANLDRFYENDEAFADHCILNHAKFHKTCQNSFDNYHFE